MVDNFVKVANVGANAGERIYVYPTDTVWGIGGDISSQRIYEQTAIIKKTERDKPVSILFHSVPDLMTYFDLQKLVSRPDKVGVLERFFGLETTLCLDLGLLRPQRHIPWWIYQQSDVVAVRCLPFPWIGEMIEENGGRPVITTSLNFHGDPPILDLVGASAFVRLAEAMPEVDIPLVLKPGDDQRGPSGKSSSIVRLSASGELTFLREGGRVQEIRNLLLQLHPA